MKKVKAKTSDADEKNGVPKIADVKKSETNSTYNAEDNEGLPKTSPVKEKAGDNEGAAFCKTTIGLLKNGHRPELKPIKINVDTIVLSNTCAFDVFVQILCVAYCDSDECKTFLENDDSDISKLVCHIVRKGVNISAYQLRAKVLSLAFDTKVSPYRVCAINAACTMSFLVNTVWFFQTQLEESICSSKLCPDMARKINSTIITVQLREFNTVRQVGKLQSKLDEAMKNKTTRCYTNITEYCPTLTAEDFVLDTTISEWPICSGTRTTTTTVCGDFLFIEVIEPNPQHTVELTCKLSDLPVQLTTNRTFTLRGVATFVGAKSAKSVGHYIAFCRRNDSSWISYDDLRNNASSSTGSETVRIHLLVYTT